MNKIQQKLMSFRNEWKLYKRNCDATNKVIISAYDKNMKFPVYSNEYWWSDKWSASDFNVEYNFEKDFFEQFYELFKKVPRDWTSVFKSENSDYNSHIRESKNCYLNSLVYLCEEVLYSYWMVKNTKCLDCVMVNNSELCYECIDIEKCYNCDFLYESTNCNNCFYSFQLENCSNCIWCSNLVNKSYYILNKEVSKEEFKTKKEELINWKNSSKKWTKKFLNNMLTKTVHKNLHNINSENCSWDHLENCKNCVESFDWHNSEDIKNVISFSDSKNITDSYSVGWPGCNNIHLSSVIRGSSNVKYSNYIFLSNNLEYCDSCISCEDCFGCIWLRHKKYHILNKEYSKQEYFELKEKIISNFPNYWEFFPQYISAFSYNETVAQDFYKLDKNQTLEQWFIWKDLEENSVYSWVEYKIEDSIKDVDNEIITKILNCETCEKNYRIIDIELKFYKSKNISIPKNCANCRHSERMEHRNSRELFQRKCDKCSCEMKSTYSENREEKIYCEECFKREIY